MVKSNRQRKERVMAGGLAVVTLLVIVFFVTTMMGTYREYEHFLERERRIVEELSQVRKDFERKEAYIDRLNNDPEFLERVARERLGFARPDELVFRFEN